MGNLPKRRKGTEKVTTFDVTSRMTKTSSGFGGSSLDDMFCVSWFLVGVKEAMAAAEPARRKMPATVFRFVIRLRWREVDDVLRALVP
jgi:hypothetical protein